MDNLAYSSEDTVDTFGSSTDSRKHLRPLKYQNIHPAFISQLGGAKSTRKYFSDPRHPDPEKYYRRQKEVNRPEKYRLRKAEHYYEDQQNISFPPSGSWQLSRKPLRPGPLSLGAELDYKNFNYNYGMFVTEELYGWVVRPTILISSWFLKFQTDVSHASRPPLWRLQKEERAEAL